MKKTLSILLFLFSVNCAVAQEAIEPDQQARPYSRGSQSIKGNQVVLGTQAVIGNVAIGTTNTSAATVTIAVPSDGNLTIGGDHSGTIGVNAVTGNLILGVATGGNVGTRINDVPEIEVNSLGVTISTSSLVTSGGAPLQVNGAETVGSTYINVAPPTNGLLVVGSTAIGTSVATAPLTVNGTATATTFSGSGASLTAIPLGTATTGVLPVAQGGTNAASASITAFNNITGYTASGATGTTSTNLVFSTSPTLVTPALGTPASGVMTNVTGIGTTNMTAVTGTPSSTTFLRGDNTWATPSGGSSSLGTSASAPAPASTANAGTGVYSSNATQFGVAISSTMQVSIGTTGMNLANALSLANGGTGATTASAAFGAVFSYPLSTSTYPLGIATGTTAEASGTNPDVLTPILASVYLGPKAGAAATLEANSVYIGNYAGSQMTSDGYYEHGGFATVGNGFNNIGIGAYAMGAANVTGCASGGGFISETTAIGAYSLANIVCSSGSNGANTAVGDVSGNNITTGAGDTIMGADTQGPTTGSHDSFFGYNAGGFGTLATGNYDTYIGDGAGSITNVSGSYDIFIGGTEGSNAVDAPTSSTSNFLNIGNTIFGTGILTGTVASPAGKIGIGTASPRNSATLDVNGGLNVSGSGIYLTNITTGTNADFLCRASTGQVLLQTSACTISKRILKENFLGITAQGALDDIMRLKPTQFNFKTTVPANPDPNATMTQYGFIADEVAAVDPKLAVYDDDMATPKSYRQEAIIALLVRAVQEQQEELQNSGHSLLHRCISWLPLTCE